MRYRVPALFMALALLAVVVTGPAEATQYTSWLQCDGNYSGVRLGETPLYTSTTNVDFGESFSSINSITIYWYGQVTAGLWGYPGHQSPWRARFGAYLLDDTGAIKSSTYTGYMGSSQYPSPESFDLASQFTLTIPGSGEAGSWDDLLDGRASLGFVLQMEPMDPMNTPRATGSITAAMLVVDAEPMPTPEPSCALPALLGLGCLARRLRQLRNARRD